MLLESVAVIIGWANRLWGRLEKNVNKRLLIYGILVIFIFTALVGCGSANVVARVNGEKILRGDLEKKVEEMKSSLASQGVDFESEQGREIEQKIETEALNQLINETLLMQQAEKEQVVIVDAQVNEQIDSLKQQFGEEMFQTLLKQQNLTEEDLREQLKLQLTADALFKKVTEDVSVSDSEVSKYFDENKNDLEEMKVAHILISVPSSAAESEIKAAEEKAEELIQQIKSGEDFAQLAKENSADSQSAENGGVMDMYFTRQDPFLMDEFVKGAFELGEGQISQKPVRTAYGFHIIKVLDKRSSYEELEPTVKERLVSEKKNQLFVKYFSDLKEKAKIENMLVK